MKNNKGLFHFFITHKVAANLLMSLIIILGLFSIFRLNIQFLPNIDLNYITITVPWVGASASDVERSVIVPLEKKLRDIDGLKKMFGRANFGSGVIILQFNANANMSQAYQDTQQRISTVVNLPDESEKPIVTKIERYEPIGKIIITGSDSVKNIRQLAYDYEKELLDLGIAKINIIGMPIQELAVEVPPEKLHALGMTLPQIANLVNEYSKDASLGTLGKNDTAKELRMIKAVRDINALAGVPVANIENEQVTTLGDIAHIRLRHREGESLFFRNGKPAIELQLLRSPNDNSFHVAKIMHQWFQKAKPESQMKGVTLKIYDERWLLIKERINLLLHNGATGFVLIILVLSLFLNRRVAFWVAVSIPISCLAGLFALYLFGGSLNMVSLFSIIMSLGIIVDDSIVVGENAFHEFHEGNSPTQAALAGAKRMFIPVLGSSLTTISAFLPLIILGDTIGQILFAIPLMVICIIIASLIECFLVLPYHLKQSFKHLSKSKESKFRNSFNKKFHYFKEVTFNNLLIKALTHKWHVIITALASLFIVYSLFAGEHVPFTFFQIPDSNRIKLNVTFIPGTKTEEVKKFLLKARADLIKLSKERKNKHPDEPMLAQVITESLSKTADLRGDQQVDTGENVGHLNVELSRPDERDITNNEVIALWRPYLVNTPGIVNLVLASPRGGPPGRDIDISINGKNPNNLKRAAIFIKSKLQNYAGVENISDNLPGGREQWLLSLKPSAIKQGVTIQNISAQVGAGFGRRLAQRITEGQDEIDLVVSLPDQYKHNLLSFLDFPVLLPNNKMVRLDSLVNVKAVRGFDRLVHENGLLSVNVTANVDATVTNANQVLSYLKKSALNKLYELYNVNYQLKGRAEEQAKTLAEMKMGLLMGLVLIYLILALIFSDYVWPILLMIMIPFGVFGAVLGHLIMGYDMTILSLFGLFGLSGIVMNDSIILINTYKSFKEKGMPVFEALVAATKLRLRPVILTSITTIAGLIPILFETSQQARFLIPMVISLVFGLSFTSILVLFVLPCIFVAYETQKIRHNSQIKSN